MENPLRKQIRSIMKDHKKRQMWYRIVTTLAVVVVFVTTYMLILPAITMENKAECGITEHKHDANCYSSHYEKEKELACTTDSLGVHKHTNACYDAEHKLICGYADFVIHEHDASCYDKDGNLVCTIPEHKLHQHTPECYQMQKQLVCTQEESVGHTHTPECYTKQQGALICGKEEHTHGEGCYDAEGNLICTLEEHTHSDECYEWNDILTCTIPESAGHTHSEACYQDVQVLICEEPAELHTHTAECYKDGVLACGKLELKEHKHSETCFTEKQVLVETLICDRVEHVHTDECYKGSGQKEEQSSVASEEVTSEDASTEENSTEEISSEELSTEEVSTEDVGLEETSTEEASSQIEEASSEADTDAEETSLETSSEDETEVESESEPEESSSIEAETEEESSEEISTEEESSEEESFEETSTEETSEEELTSEEASTEEETSEAEEESSEEETSEADDFIDQWELGENGALFIAYTSDDDVMGLEDAGLLSIASLDEETNEDRPMLYRVAARAANTAPTGTEFKNYITSAKVQKIVNGEWQPAKEFENDDNVKVELKYTLPDGIVTPNNKSIWYQLPNGVVPNDNLDGIVYNKSNNPIGTYKIGKDGLIQINFYEEFATGKEITGDIFFSGKVESSNTKEDQKIEFGGSSESITIKKETEEEAKTDIAIKKEGKLSDSKDKIMYTVTVSSILGTGEKVNVYDYLKNGTYEGTVKVVTKSGNEIQKDQYQLTINNNDTKSEMKIENLPELKAGESYVITYEAKPGKRSANGELNVDNSVSTNKGKNDYCSIKVNKAFISKSGEYKSDKNVIEWTITIDPDGTDLKGYTLSDKLDGKDLSGKKATLTYSDGTTEEITLPYTFKKSTNGKVSCKIVYQTKIDPNQMSGNVRNDATIEKDGDKYEAGTDVGYTRRDWDLTKYKDKEEKVKGEDKMKYTWKSTITLPDKNLSSLGAFTYEDTIGEPSIHSASKTELDKQIKDNIEFEYLDENGTLMKVTGSQVNTYFDYQITYTPEDAVSVSGFNIVFTPKQNLQIRGKQIVLSYATNADTSSVPSGGTTTFTNTAKVNGIEKKVIVNYKKPVKIQKASSAEGALKPPSNIWWATDYEYRGYINSQAEVKLSENGYLYYRLILNLEEAQDVNLSDLLPIGTTYVEGSAFAAYCKLSEDGMVEAITYAAPPINTIVSVKNQTNVSGEAYQELIMKLSNINQNTLLEKNGYIAVYYAVKVDDSVFNVNGTASLKNTATWEKESASNTTNVKRFEKIVDKSGKQVFDDQNKPVDAVKYRVVINPEASNLDVEKDTLTLVDTISYTKLYSVSLNLDSVKLYHYDPNQENLCGNEISSTRYQIRYDSQAGKMKVVVPDQLACVLVYQYNYDKGKLADISDASISNSVKLMGESSKSDITQLKVNDSGASAHQNIEIYKVDSTDFTKKLSGAKFKLEYWNNVNGTWSWTQIGNEYVSGDGSNGTKLGEIELPLDKSGKKAPNTIWENYIYRLTETEAPTGYAKRTEPYYFVRTKTTNIWDWNGYASLTNVEKNALHKISISGENIYIPNVASGVSVRKVWVNQDGSQISDPTGSIKVQLYKSTGKIDGANVTVKWANYSDSNANISYLVKRGSTVIITTSIGYADFNCSDSAVEKSVKIDSKGNKTYVFSCIKNDCDLIGSDYHNQKNYGIDYTEATDVIYGSSSEVGETVTLDKDNNWSHEWTNLEAGENIYYYVKEVGDHSGYTVSYMNNGGIRSGEIVITNKVEEQPIVLPETGGTGTYWYTMGGVLLTAGAAFLIYKKHMQKGGRRIW